MLLDFLNEFIQDAVSTKVQVAELPIGHGKEISGMGVSMEETVLQHLTQRTLDQNVHQLARIKVHGSKLALIVQTGSLHPFHCENLGRAQVRVDFRDKYI